MRVVFLPFLLFSFVFALHDQSVYNEVAGRITENFKDSKELGKLRKELSEKIKEIVEKLENEHGFSPKDTQTNMKPTENPQRLDNFSKFLEKVKEESKAEMEKHKKTKEEKNGTNKEIHVTSKEKVEASENDAISEIKEKEDKIKNSTPNTTTTPTVRQMIPNLNDEQKKKLVDELFTVVGGLVNATRAKEEEKRKKKEKFKDEMKPVLQEILSNLKTKFESWKKAKTEEIAQKWEAIRELLSLLKQKAEEKKKEADSWRRATWEVIEDRIETLLEDKNSTTTVKPVAKGTFLDQISGTSSWQNVTWILLALCVFLSVALLILILSQNSRKHHYQILLGSDASLPRVYPKLDNEEQVF